MDSVGSGASLRMCRGDPVKHLGEHLVLEASREG